MDSWIGAAPTCCWVDAPPCRGEEGAELRAEALDVPVHLRDDPSLELV